MTRTISISANGNCIDSFVEGATYSYLNFYAVGELMRAKKDYRYIVFTPDGIAMALILSLLLKRKISRGSFDFTGIAGALFDEVNKKSKSIALVGGKQTEIEVFTKKIRDKWRAMNIVIASTGYLEEEEEEKLLFSLVEENPSYVIIGLGSVKQEDFSFKLRSMGFEGTIFTCGGFITQTANSDELSYYPKFFDKFNLRFLYRAYKEKHTRRRYLVSYPYAFSRMVLAIVAGSLRFTVVTPPNYRG